MPETKELSPPWARTTGLLYVGTIAGGVFSAYFVRQLIVRGDAVATAHNLLASEQLFRFGVAAEFAGILCYVAVTALLYHMLKPVNARLSLMAAFFSIAGCAVGAVNLMNDLVPFTLLGGAPYLSVFSESQLQALAYSFLRFGGLVNAVGLTFFGFYCLLIGALFFRATFVPKFIGLALMISGLAWLTGNLSAILSPPLAAMLAPLQFVGILGEATLTVWLLVMGVNVTKWREQAAAATD